MRHRTRGVVVGLVLVGILALASTGIGIALLQRSAESGRPTPQGTPVYGATHVFMRNNTYQPDNIQVVVGKVVTWTNEDTAIHSLVLPHTMTAVNIVRTSGPLGQGQSFSYEFASRGTFEYSCEEHPVMIGIVTVE
jgi:plastocyanin